MRILILIISLVFSCEVCSTQKPSVVASASMFADMTNVLAGDLINLQMIVPIGADPHLHDPTPRDARIVAHAELILMNGLTFEGWINELIENSGTKANIVVITEGIDAIESKQYKGSTDPHAWMTASNGRVYIKNIKNALIQLMPEHASEIQKNYMEYDASLKDLDNHIKATINRIPSDYRILITSHDAFAYFGKEYGIRLEPIIGISTEAEAQTSDIRRVNNTIKESGVPAVFIESTINPKLLQQIAKDNNISIGGELYADSLGGPEGSASNYIDMLRHNINTIYNGLVGKKEYFPDESSGDNKLWVYLALLLIMILGFFYVYNKMS